MIKVSYSKSNRYLLRRIDSLYAVALCKVWYIDRRCIGRSPCSQRNQHCHGRRFCWHFIFPYANSHFGCLLPLPLAAFKKYICLGASIIGTVLLFIIPGQLAYGANAAQGIAESSGAKVDVDTSYQIGFWLMLVFLIALVALSVIQLFNLKGNKVFEAVNASDNTASGQGMTMPHIDTEKITGFAQNVAGTVSGQIKNIAESMANKPASAANNQQGTVQQTPPVSQPVPQQPQAQPAIQTASVPVSPAPVMQTEENKNPEEVMELLKKLFEMKEAGILTDDEFTAKKQEMLKKM